MQSIMGGGDNVNKQLNVEFHELAPKDALDQLKEEKK
jgi:hypothetical protein